MNKTIFIAYHPQQEQHPWLQLDESGQSIQAESRSTLAEIASIAADSAIKVFLPGDQVYCTSINLPGLHYQQLIKAIPYAIEEEISEDVQHLHFALSPPEKGQAVHVCAVSRHSLEAILQVFRQNQLHIEALIPDFFALPYAENQWHFAVFDQRIMVRSQRYAGFTLPLASLEQVLPLMLQQESGADKILVAGSHTEPLEALLTAMHRPYEIRHATSFLHYALKSLPPATYINLLQGPYTVKHKTRKALKAWYLAGTLLCFWLILAFTGEIFRYFYYSHQVSQLNRQVEALYRQVFPEAAVVVSPKLRIQREIEQYRHAATEADFLFLLGKLGAVLQEKPDMRLQHLSFQNHVLNFSIQAPQFADLQNLTQRLSAAGVAITQTQAASQDDHVEASYQLRMGGRSS